MKTIVGVLVHTSTLELPVFDSDYNNIHDAGKNNM